MKYYAEFTNDDMEVTDVVEFRADDDDEAMMVIAECMKELLIASARVEVTVGAPDGYREH